MITIPEYLWRTMLDEFCKEDRQIEQVCYFDGIQVGGDGVATTVTFPNAKLASGNFDVSPEAMSQAGKHFRVYRMARLVQIHTHPGPWVGHSPWDDQRAYSQMVGAISVVLPNHARGRPALTEAGIHIRTSEGWRELGAQDAAQYVRLVPSILDFRPQRKAYDERTNLRPARERSWWSVLAFWRH